MNLTPVEFLILTFSLGIEVNSLLGGTRTRTYASIADSNVRQSAPVNGLQAKRYSMDGAEVVSYISGMAEQENAFAEISIRNPDSIAEFKVEASLCDFNFGVSSRAKVEVVIRGGCNNVFNANDFFCKPSELDQGLPNKPHTVKPNTLVFTD